MSVSFARVVVEPERVRVSAATMALLLPREGWEPMGVAGSVRRLVKSAILFARDSELSREQLGRTYLEGDGIEIGALHCPLPVSGRARVTYVDRLTTAEQREHYPELSGERLVDVGIVTDAETLATVTDGSQDFVIANHVLEHFEDPIGGLETFFRVLRPDGILFLTVPDMRFTFDVDRPVTSIEHALADHTDGGSASRSGHYREFIALVEKAPADRIEARAAELDASGYSIHFHAWTAEAILELLLEVQKLVPFAFLTVHVAERHGEVIAVLRKG